MQGTAHAVEQQLFDTVGIVCVVGIGAVEDWLDPLVIRDRRELIVVMTEDDPAVVPKIGEHLGLCLQHTVAVAEVLKMAEADVGDD